LLVRSLALFFLRVLVLESTLVFLAKVGMGRGVGAEREAVVVVVDSRSVLNFVMV
jgi:hypothetical protein